MKMIQNQLTNRLSADGFSLIESMIVIVIIALLASISVTAYVDYVAKSYVTAMFSTFNMLRKASEEYVSTQNAFPSAEDLNINSAGDGITVDPAYFGNTSKSIYQVYCYGGTNSQRIDLATYSLKTNSPNYYYNELFRLTFTRTKTNPAWSCKIRSGEKKYAPAGCQTCSTVDNGDRCD